MRKLAKLVLAVVGTAVALAVITLEAVRFVSIPGWGFPWSVVALLVGGVLVYLILGKTYRMPKRLAISALLAATTYALTFALIWMFGATSAAASCALGGPCAAGLVALGRVG